jgi:hypothetical protein
MFPLIVRDLSWNFSGHILRKAAAVCGDAGTATAVRGCGLLRLPLHKNERQVLGSQIAEPNGDL